MRRIFQIISFLLVGFGVLCSGYLLARYAQMLAPSGGGILDICATVFGASCDETLASPVSIQFGLPLSGWGLVYYGLVGSLLLISWLAGDFLRTPSTALLAGLSVIGGGISIVLAGMMLSEHAPDCGACYAVHATNLTLIPLFFLQAQTPPREIAAAWKAGVGYVFGARVADPDLAVGRVLGLLVPFLVGLALYQGVLLQLQMRAGVEHGSVRADRVLAAWEATPAEQIPPDPADAVWGPDDAPAELVVFSDFQCPACSDFAFDMESLRRQFESGLRIVFKHYPLDDACNPAVEGNFHVHACWAARLAQAAREHEKFWPAHDALFGMLISDDRKAVLEEVAGATGLSVDVLKETMQSPEIKSKVARDIQAGMDLGIPGTPTAFLNGKILTDMRPEALRVMILQVAREDGEARPYGQ